MSAAMDGGAVAMLALAFVGAALLAVGLRVRRRGDLPHCKRCDYVLLGLRGAGLQCPECGAMLSDGGNVVRGERFRRPIVAVCGMLVLLGVAWPLGASVARSYRSINWVRVRPTAWLLDDAERKGSVQATRELGHRYTLGVMSAAQRDRFVHIALAEQAKPALGPNGPDLLNHLGEALAAGELTESQQSQFFRQMVKFSVQTRSRARVGDALPCVVEEGCRGPVGRGECWVKITYLPAKFDGATRTVGGSSKFCGAAAGGSTTFSMPVKTAGRHKLTVRARVQIYKGQHMDEDVDQLINEHDELLNAEVDVADRSDATKLFVTL
jgi:hypothetical protein